MENSAGLDYFSARVDERSHSRVLDARLSHITPPPAS